MSCDEGRPCKRCLSRGMADLCRDGKCKRRGRKRKSEMGSVEDPENDSEDDTVTKVRGRPKKFVTDASGNPTQTNNLALVEAKREVVDELIPSVGGPSPMMVVDNPSLGYDLIGDQSSRAYYTGVQSMQRLEDNSMGSIFSSYNMYPSVLVPMNTFQTTSQGYLMKGDDSIFSPGDYPPGLIESRYQNPLAFQAVAVGPMVASNQFSMFGSVPYCQY